jgi:ribosome maturation factor RimP
LEAVLNKKEIEETVEKLVMDIIETAGGDGGKIEVVDVEYVKERDFYLRVFLDKTSGIELDDCRLISELLENKLDGIDLIKDQYYLEVSSPGLDRQLKKEKDFIRHAGDMVEIKLYQPLDGAKTFLGTLVELKDGVIHIKDAKEPTVPDKKGKKEKKPIPPAQTKDLAIPWKDAASIRLHIDF